MVASVALAVPPVVAMQGALTRAGGGPVADGGGWSIGTWGVAARIVVDAASFKQFCSSKGMALAGREIQNPAAWLAMKRALWEDNHPLHTAGWPTGGAQLHMPMVKKPNVGAPPLSTFDDKPAVLPPNLTGDAGDTKNNEVLCGYGYHAGWSDPNQNLPPDPEDWAPANQTGGSWYSCMFW